MVLYKQLVSHHWITTSMQSLADICPHMVTAQSCSPVGCSCTIAGKSHTSMAMTTKQTESYLTVPHSLSSHPPTDDIVPPIVPTSIKQYYITLKNPLV